MEPSVGIMELVLSVGKVVTSPQGGKICYQCHAYDEILSTQARENIKILPHVERKENWLPALSAEKREKCYRCHAGVM